MLPTLRKRESAFLQNELWQPVALARKSEGFLVILRYQSCYSNILVF